METKQRKILSIIGIVYCLIGVFVIEITFYFNQVQSCTFYSNSILVEQLFFIIMGMIMFILGLCLLFYISNK